MNLIHFLSILRARWVAVLGVFLVTVIATVVVTLLVPKQYYAAASVLVDMRAAPLAGVLLPEKMNQQLVTTQIDVMRSPRVAQGVVRGMKLGENNAIRAQWLEATGGEGNIETWLIETFQKNLAITPSPESSVVTIGYTAPDPRFAAAMANAFVRSYIDTNLELIVDPAKRFSGFFENQVKEARERLEQAQVKLSAFQRQNGIIATDERIDIETSRLNQLSQELVQIQALMSEAGSRQAQAVGPSGDKMQEVLTNPVVNGLKAELSRSEARLEELNARYGDQHPQVIEARASIAELRKRIDAETRRVTGGVGVTANINKQREAQTRSALAAQRLLVLRMKQVRDEGAVLLRDIDSATKTYETLLARFEQSKMESQSNSGGAVQLTVAQAPLQPSSPKLGLNIALAVFVGLLLGVGTGLLLEMLNRRVRSPMDLDESLGLPVLGVMPKPNAKRLFRQRPSLMQQRVMGQLPAPPKAA